jgi:hypothetical protein
LWFLICDRKIADQENGGGHDVQRFDWLGAFTGVAGLVLFNVAWNRAPAVGWQSAQAIVPLIISFVFLLLFFLIEKRASQPLIPIDRISKGAVWALLVTTMGLAELQNPHLLPDQLPHASARRRTH